MTKLYDWRRWFRSGRFSLRRGVDYHCSPASISQQIRNAAVRHGVRVRIEVGPDDRFVVTVVGRSASAHAQAAC